MADRMWRRRAEGHVHELTSLFCGMENQQILSNNDTPRNRSVSDGKESACSAGDPGSIPGWGRSPGEGNGSPLQYSCLENSMDTGA